MKGFTVSSQLMGIRSMSDGGMGLNFHTQELQPQEKAEVMNFHMQQGWLLFAPNEIAESDIPKQPAEVGQKTPSQRLRAVLYVLWEQLGSKGEFESFYITEMEKYIDHVKNKLDKQ